ncbi:MAG: UDP-N-acetylglucosamine--N-acetylmuramyl-(pentapeptide) pyrophosphoryl-undecaprenol [Pseudomonadota bacterium]|jgi:UDP-N-acetylglucosamine--N-acetylmuramyl-(pentapeptide) pyrophosphoryl-undecaprenol N-acetylglucosamine transferase
MSDRPAPSSSAPIVLAAGGTGGHMFPAEALARALIARGQGVLLVTDIRGKAFGDAMPEVAVERVRCATAAPGILGKVRMAVELARGTLQAMALLKRVAPPVVVGFGGYPSAPTVLAAQRLGIPVVLHEQNAVLGRANRLLSRQARRFCTSYDSVKGLEAVAADRVVRTGNPVRPAIVTLRDRPYAAPVPGGSLNLLVTGGSQGAAIFGEVVPRAVEMLGEDLRARLSIVQQARAENIQAATQAYRAMGVQATLSPFFRDMPDRLAACHLMVARSGAGTVSELTVVGRPSILVPYQHAMDDHQTANARALAAAGGAWVVPQPDFTAEGLAARLHALLADPSPLAAMAAAAHAWGMPDAGERLADAVLEIAYPTPSDRRTAA